MRYFLSALFFTFSSWAQNIQGNVFNTTTNLPLAGAKISLLPDALNTVSDSQGHFSLQVQTKGRKTITVELDQYKTLIIREILVQSGKVDLLNAGLTEANTDIDEVNVIATRNRTLANVHTITAEQVLRFPATYFDPARMVINYPGVAGAHDQANGLIIHGHSPDASVWRLEGVEIVNPNHLTNAGTVSDRPTLTAGGQSILSAQMLGQTTFYNGTLPSSMGNATSGLIDMSFRQGNLYQRNHTVQAGLIGLDLSTEGPIKEGKSSYLINYRYSFTGVLAKMGVRFGGEAIDFQDGGLNLFFKTKKGQFKVFGLWGDSNNSYLSPVSEAPTTKKELFNIDYNNTVGIGGIQYRGNINAKTGFETTLVLSKLGAHRNANGISILAKGGFEIDEFEHGISSLRSVFKTAISAKTIVSYGFGLNLNQQHFDSKTDLFNTKLGAVQQATWFYVDPFVNVEKQVNEKLTLHIGARLFALISDKIYRPEPRLFAKYKLTNDLSFMASYGRQSQIQKIMYGNLAPSSSHNISLGLEGHFNKIFWQVNAYQQNTWNVPTSDFNRIANQNVSISAINEIENTTYNTYTSGGLGKNKGVDLGLQRYLTSGWYGIFSSSIYQVLFAINNNNFQPGRFNGRFTNSFVIGKEFRAERKWTFGINGRLIYNGGYYEPLIDLPASKLIKQTVYDFSKGYTEKLPDFFRLDLKFYANKNIKGRTNSFSIDIQNATAQQNRSFSYYDPIADQIQRPLQMGLVPLMSYRINF